MLSRSNSVHGSTSTPKRRRVGIGRISRQKLNVFGKKDLSFGSPATRPASPIDRNDDPPLPCNQIEYLCDSENTSSCNDIPCSPDVLECSITKNMEKWDSFLVSKGGSSILSQVSKSVIKEINEIEDISDELFCSNLEQSSGSSHLNSILLTSRCQEHFREHIDTSFEGVRHKHDQVQSEKEKCFRKNIEQSFDALNHTILDLEKESNPGNNKSSFFETKDSFLLDIRETGIVLKENEKESKDSNNFEKDSFYGLPMITKSLFKSYRNIEKFYDWQEECLNLPAIKERRNLIYALPTSGGKTLVAEVLMLREVLCRKKNALFILPFVAIVQEKIWALSPFAVQLEFLVEEYAAGKGHIPPKKRRKKNSIYIATIEKGLALVRSLIEENRLDELGLIVVDELHLIGEPGRGATLEILLSTALFAKKNIQIVGMSATIGNLPELATFLRAEVFTREFRPVELSEYVKLGDMLHKLEWKDDQLEIVPHRQLAFNYSPAGESLDPDRLGGLVSEVVPGGACLLFCPTKRNCENVAALLCKLQRKEMITHRSEERRLLSESLKAEGSGTELQWAVRCGIAYHHAGLSADERVLLEHAFRSGIISVLCCTSTLAAGVNLPAQRVIVRAPKVGRSFMTLAAYRQMAGRAGRAGVCDTGESIIICSYENWVQLKCVLSSGLGAARSVLAQHVSELLLSGAALGLASTRVTLRDLLGTTLLAVSQDESPIDTKQICDDALCSLLQSGALELTDKNYMSDNSRLNHNDCTVYNDSQLVVSKLGRAAIKGCMDLSVANQLQSDLKVASQSLVLMGSLHLLYLVTPHNGAGCMDLSVANQLLSDLKVASQSLVLMGSLHLLYLVTPHNGGGVTPDYRHYYSLYCNLDDEGIQTAKILGITEMNAIRMITGKPITNVSESVLQRFYLALMLHDLWKQMPFPEVAEKYCIPRGTVQMVMTSSAAFASCAQKFCEEIEELWAFRALFGELAPRLQTCAAPELHQLMELPAVKKARAMQLYRSGFKRVEDIAKASADELVSAVEHLSRSAATHLISAARMMLIEKVESLRAEAEDVMEGLQM